MLWIPVTTLQQLQNIPSDHCHFGFMHHQKIPERGYQRRNGTYWIAVQVTFTYLIM